MNLKQLFALSCLMLVVMTMGNCGTHANSSGTALSTPSNPSSFTHEYSTISPLSTSVPIILATTTIPAETTSSKVTPTVKLTSTITPTFIPALSIDDAYRRLSELLTNNGNCLLPCLWGIMPGASTSQEGQNILAPLSAISLFASFDRVQGFISLLNTLDDLNIIIDIGYLTYQDVDNSIISSLYFKADAMQDLDGDRVFVPVFDSDEFGESLRSYMLPQVLSEYGIPTSVLISSLSEPMPKERGGDTGDFRIILIYPDQGILVNYRTNILVAGNNVAGCLNAAHVMFELFPPGNGRSFVSNLPPSLQEDILNNFRPIEEVSSLSTERFYEEYRHPTDQCLETPAILWPTPER